LERADVHPQPDSVHPLSEPRYRREQQQDHGRDPEEVAIRLQYAVVVAERNERSGQDGHADAHPQRLAASVVGVEAVVQRKPETGEHGGEREQSRVRVRDRAPDDDVGGEVEPEEEGAVRRRARLDLCVTRDRHRGERDPRDHPRDDEPEELAIACGQRLRNR
jgi:hypothetical protein